MQGKRLSGVFESYRGFNSGNRVIARPKMPKEGLQKFG
jgi:hypothetical protein